MLCALRFRRGAEGVRAIRPRIGEPLRRVPSRLSLAGPGMISSVPPPRTAVFGRVSIIPKPAGSGQGAIGSDGAKDLPAAGTQAKAETLAPRTGILEPMPLSSSD